MKHTGIIRTTLGKSDMKHYHLDFGNQDAVCCVGETRVVLEKGNFEFCLSYDKKGVNYWNYKGVQLQIKVWNFKSENNIKIETRNESQYNSFEIDINLNSITDFDNLICGLQELKEIFIKNADM